MSDLTALKGDLESCHLPHTSPVERLTKIPLEDLKKLSCTALSWLRDRAGEKLYPHVFSDLEEGLKFLVILVLAMAADERGSNDETKCYTVISSLSPIFHALIEETRKDIRLNVIGLQQALGEVIKAVMSQKSVNWSTVFFTYSMTISPIFNTGLPLQYKAIAENDPNVTTDSTKVIQEKPRLRVEIHEEGDMLLIFVRDINYGTDQNQLNHHVFVIRGHKITAYTVKERKRKKDEVDGKMRKESTVNGFEDTDTATSRRIDESLVQSVIIAVTNMP
ncbi:hypothetical protein Ciccas_006078 [Cichlidogyrus casuarinus]|uniref:Uncharacterized protein n=1 Tax=Cichlidogyrus casuarinus TaxID=1844966 RepID=A0ABD2Q6U2_9PLAT